MSIEGNMLSIGRQGDLKNIGNSDQMAMSLDVDKDGILSHF